MHYALNPKIKTALQAGLENTRTLEKQANEARAEQHQQEIKAFEFLLKWMEYS